MSPLSIQWQTFKCLNSVDLGEVDLKRVATIVLIRDFTGRGSKVTILCYCPRASGTRALRRVLLIGPVVRSKTVSSSQSLHVVARAVLPAPITVWYSNLSYPQGGMGAIGQLITPLREELAFTLHS